MLCKEISDPCPHKIFLLWKDLSLKLRSQGSLSCPCKESYRGGGGNCLDSGKKGLNMIFFFFLWGDQTKIPKFILKANNVAWGGSLTPLSFVILQREKHPLEVEKVTHEDVLFNEYDVREHLWHTLTPEPSLWANWTALLSKGYRILLWV